MARVTGAKSRTIVTKYAQLRVVRLGLKGNRVLAFVVTLKYLS